MERIPLSKLLENARTGRINREAYYEKLCRDIYEMPLIYCIDKTDRSYPYEKIDQVMEEVHMYCDTPKEYQNLRYGDVIIEIYRYRQSSDEYFRNRVIDAIRKLGEFAVGVSADEEGKGVTCR